jgi:diacylglycerol kinase family enzyme
MAPLGPPSGTLRALASRSVFCPWARQTMSHGRWVVLSIPPLPRWVLDPWRRDAVGSLSFLHAATLGLNAEFAHLATDASRRAALGGLTYPASSLEALTHLRSIAVRLQLTGVPARNPATGR